MLNCLIFVHWRRSSGRPGFLKTKDFTGSGSRIRLVSPWEAWLAASLIIQNTTRLRIGLGVTNPYTRHPVVMAQMACTLQTLSQGRLSLSIGKGMARFLEKAGVRQHEKAVEECVEIIRHLTKGERFSLEGEAFRSGRHPVKDGSAGK